MADFSWLDFLNKMTNLACLIGLGIYLVRSQLIPFIKETIQDRAHELALLEQESNECVIEKKRIMQEVAEYQVYSETLLQKMKQWKNALKLQKEAREQEKIIIQQASENYLKKRADGLCQKLLQQQIFDQVMKQSSERVFAFFKKADAQKVYITHLVKDLRKTEA